MSNENHRESLSALVDGELAPAPAQRLLDAAGDDPVLRAEWRRHHVISAVLSGHGDEAAEVAGIADRVREALDREPVALPSRRNPPSRRWTGWGAAAAASVAVAAVVVAFGLSGDGPGNEPAQVAVAPTPQAPEPFVAPVTVAAVGPAAASDPVARTRLTWNDTAPAVEARLNGYLLNHNEYLSGGVRGMLPYARVVGYDSRN